MTRHKAFGQVATQQCLDEAKPFLNRLMFFLIGWALTVLQFIVTAGLLYMPTCSAMSNDCPSSQWCPLTDEEFGTSKCTRCASATQTESDFDFTRFYDAAMPDVTDYVHRQACTCRIVVLPCHTMPMPDVEDYGDQQACTCRVEIAGTASA